jgi:hypothetical protein
LPGGAAAAAAVGSGGGDSGRERQRQVRPSEQSRGGDPGEPLSDSSLSLSHPTGTTSVWNLLAFVNPSFSSSPGRSYFTTLNLVYK